MRELVIRRVGPCSTPGAASSLLPPLPTPADLSPSATAAGDSSSARFLGSPLLVFFAVSYLCALVVCHVLYICTLVRLVCACSLGLCHHVFACVYALCATLVRALALRNGAMHCAAPLVQCLGILGPSPHLAQTLEPLVGGEESSPSPSHLPEQLEGRELTPIPVCCSGHWFGARVRQRELNPNARTLKEHPHARQRELTPNAGAQGCCY